MSRINRPPVGPRVTCGWVATRCPRDSPTQNSQVAHDRTRSLAVSRILRSSRTRNAVAEQGIGSRTLEELDRRAARTSRRSTVLAQRSAQSCAGTEAMNEPVSRSASSRWSMSRRPQGGNHSRHDGRGLSRQGRQAENNRTDDTLPGLNRNRSKLPLELQGPSAGSSITRIFVRSNPGGMVQRDDSPSAELATSSVHPDIRGSARRSLIPVSFLGNHRVLTSRESRRGPSRRNPRPLPMPPRDRVRALRIRGGRPPGQVRRPVRATRGSRTFSHRASR
jgi:hypothetical protein